MVRPVLEVDTPWDVRLASIRAWMVLALRSALYRAEPESAEEGGGRNGERVREEGREEGREERSG